MKEKTRLLSFSAMAAAVAFVLTALGSLLDVLDITTACLASFTVMLVVIEAGYPWAVMTYAVVSALSLLIPANKTPAVFFAAFFGVYAILRFVIQKIYPLWLRWTVKMLSFNAMIAVCYLLWRFVFTVGTLKDVPIYITVVAVVLAQAVFIMYDVATDRIIKIYFFRFHDRVSEILKKK